MMMSKLNVLLLAFVMCGASCLCMHNAQKGHTEFDREMSQLAVIYAAEMNNPEIYDFFKQLQEKIEKEEIEKEVSGKSSSAPVRVIPRQVPVK